MIEWCNANQGFVMTLLTFVYVVATLIRVCISIFQAKLTRRSIISAEQAEKRRHRPHVVFDCGKRRKKGTLEIEYLRTNTRRMMYASFKKQDYFIGSGVVEAGCKTVVGKRIKQSGMFWKVDGAQNILDIRTAVIGDTYDRYWEHRHRKAKLDMAA